MLPQTLMQISSNLPLDAIIDVGGRLLSAVGALWLLQRVWRLVWVFPYLTLKITSMRRSPLNGWLDVVCEVHNPSTKGVVLDKNMSGMALIAIARPGNTKGEAEGFSSQDISEKRVDPGETLPLFFSLKTDGIGVIYDSVELIVARQRSPLDLDRMPDWLGLKRPRYWSTREFIPVSIMQECVAENEGESDG